MTLTFFCLSVIFFIALLANPINGENWFWELGNSFGFLAFSGLLILTINGRTKDGYSDAHRWIGIATLVLMLLHTAWFLFGDITVIEYLKFGAPAYMTLGLFALLLAVLVTISALLVFRKNSYHTRSTFSFWHKYLSIIILLASALHIALTGYYFETSLQHALFAILTLFILLYPLHKRINYSNKKLLLVTTVGLILMFSFALLKTYRAFQ